MWIDRPGAVGPGGGAAIGVGGDPNPSAGHLVEVVGGGRGVDDLRAVRGHWSARCYLDHEVRLTAGTWERSTRLKGAAEGVCGGPAHAVARTAPHAARANKHLPRQRG